MAKALKQWMIAMVSIMAMIASFPLNTLAQAPEGINYQAVARDLNGNALSNAQIDVRFGILSTSPTGTLLYEEEYQLVFTNDFGLFNLVIGQGGNTNNGLLANFSDIDWGADAHFLRVEINPQMQGYEVFSTTQLLSVPYALYAKSSGNRIKAGAGILVINNDSIINIGDTSNFNEIQNLSINAAQDSILLDNGGVGIAISDLNIVDDQQLSLNGKILELTGVNPSAVDLTTVLGVDSVKGIDDTTLRLHYADGLVEDIKIQGADTSDTNELVDSLVLSNSQLLLYQQGNLQAQVNLDTLGDGRLDSLASIVTSLELRFEADSIALRDSISNVRIDLASELALIDQRITQDSIRLQNLRAKTSSDSLIFQDSIRIHRDSIEVLSDTVAALRTDLNTHVAADDDLSSTNELNTGVVLNGTDLEVSDAGGTIIVDLSSLVGTDDQDLSLNATRDSILIEDGVGIDISYVLDSITDLQSRFEADSIKKNDSLAVQRGDINLNRGNIATNTTNIGNNAANIATNTTNIGTNTANIATNTSDIATNASDIATNQTDIANNTANITTNTTNIGTNTANIATNTTNIATNTSDIATNASDIATNQTDIANNTANITTNTSNIATNTTNIATNTSDIATNASDIATNQTDIANNTANITTNTTNIGANTANIATNTTNIATNTSDIATNASDIATNQTDIANNTANITTNTSNIATNTTNIATNTSDIATNASDIATNQTDIANNTANITTNTSNIATNTTNIATNTSDIATNASDIATNQTDIANNTANITTNSSNIATNTTNIATNTSDIATNATDIATNQTDIANNTTNITTNTGNIATNTANIATNTSNISDNTDSLVAHRNKINAHIAADGDLSSTNELNTSVTLTGTDLNITDAGGTLTVDLGALSGVDTDDQNLSLNAARDSILIEDGMGISYWKKEKC